MRNLCLGAELKRVGTSLHPGIAPLAMGQELNRKKAHTLSSLLRFPRLLCY